MLSRPRNIVYEGNSIGFITMMAKNVLYVGSSHYDAQTCCLCRVLTSFRDAHICCL